VFTVAGARILGVKDLPNSRIFLIDRVLYVPQGDIYTSVAKSPELQNLTRCLQKTGLDTLLKGPGPLTLFAPNDAAFGNLPRRELDQLLNDPGKLRDLLRRHVVGGTFYTAGLSNGMKLKAIGGNDLAIGDEPDCTTVDGVKVNSPDINCNNGVIHMISHML
ncbi:transforming growth factor-beta-induced protein ig-h3-like, partial [Limulus polyphemus]|uniref:Transforming growth factor-beta-induced protein ig-h3-like n=1 Tax=Limulus polyphemus TaxID=6850 RepID=A0ABM1RYE4_LIMPO